MVTQVEDADVDARMLGRLPRRYPTTVAYVAVVVALVLIVAAIEAAR